MKGFRIVSEKTCEFVECPTPVLENEDSVIVRVKCVGICGSDTGAYKKGPAEPVIMGHEVVGEVTQTGKNVTKLASGDHVVLEPLISCGKCYACRNGRPNVCEKAYCLGCQADGGMREYYMYDQDHWHKIPEDIPWLAASLIEPYTVGLEVVSRGDVMEGDYVLIHGAGPAGLIACDLCKQKGATVIVSEIAEGRLERAKKMGADYTIHAQQEDWAERTMELTGGEGPNVIIDAAGLPTHVSKGVDILSFAGRYVFMGIGAFTDATYNMLWLTGKELTLSGSRMQEHKFQPVIERAHEYLAKADTLISNVFPFEQSLEAMELAAKAAPDTAKVVVTFP